MVRVTPGERIFHWLLVLLLIIAALVMVLPFLNLLAISFSSKGTVLNNEVYFWPISIQLDTYKHVLSNPLIISSMLNTIYITAVGTFISVAMTAFLGYGLSKKYVAIRIVALQLIVFTMLFKPGIIPTYMVVRGMGLIDSRWALMIPVAINPFYLIIMKTFFQNLPEEIEESAVIEGAGAATIFFRIVIPLSMHGIATIILFYAVGRWNTFFNAVMYINDMNKYPLQVVLRELVIVGTKLDQTDLSADTIIPTKSIKASAIMVATFPILIVYPFLQKYFVKGVMIGSIKG